MIRYQYQDDDPAASLSTIEEQSDHWWSGVQKNFASVALASVLAITATSTAIAGTLVRDVEEIPAGSLSTIPEDDSWKAPPPVAASLYQRLPLIDSDETITTPPLAPDEDVGIPAKQWPLEWRIVSPAQDQDEYPHVQADEDFWVNPVFPLPASLWQRLPLGDPEELPAATLYGQPDEDFWVSGVAPVPASLWQRLPIGDPEEIPANTLRGQPDEDYWNNPVRPIPASVWQLLPIGELDEIYSFTAAPPDEDFWRNAVAPVPFSVSQRLPLGDVEEIPANTLSTIPEDDSWSKPVIQRLHSFIPSPLPDQDEYPHVQSDEDFWTSGVAPVPLTNLFPKPFAFDQPESPQPNPVEDEFWINPVRPLPASLWQKLPYAPDPEEIPARTLSTIPEDDSWQQRPGPRLAPSFVPQPWSFDAVETVCVLYEEDWHQRPLPVPASMYQRLPYLRDPEEIPARTLSTIPEDDSWIRPRVWPVLPTFLPRFASVDLEDAAGGGQKLVIWIGEEVA